MKLEKTRAEAKQLSAVNRMDYVIYKIDNNYHYMIASHWKGSTEQIIETVKYEKAEITDEKPKKSAKNRVNTVDSEDQSKEI